MARYLNVTWTAGCAAAPVIAVSSAPWVEVALPTLSKLTVSLSKSIIAPRDDLAADMGLPTTATFTVTGTFADGSTRDFTTDTRVQLSFVDDILEIADGTTNALAVKDGLGLDDAVDVVVTATFTAGGGAVVTGTATLTVDVFVSLTLSSTAYPSCTSPGCSGKAVIRRIQTASGPFQRLSLSLKAVSRKGTSFTVRLTTSVKVTFASTAVVLSASATSGAACRAAGQTNCVVADGSLDGGAVTGAGAGTTTLTAEWKGATGQLTLQVLDEATAVGGVTVTTPTSTIRVLPGGTSDMIVSTLFADGTTIKSLTGITWVKCVCCFC